jgi:hypothetical protein
MSGAIVRSFNEFSDVRRWAPRSLELQPGVAAEGWQDVDGVFARDFVKWIAIVRHERQLLVARPGEARPLASVEMVEIMPTAEGRREVNLRFEDQTVWTVEYSTLTTPLDDYDPTPFAQPDDFDFGEFLRSLVLDPDRQTRVFRRNVP